MKQFNDSAQAGGLVMLVLGILIIGFFYVAFGGLINQLWSVNNDLIAADSFHYSQSHWDTMDLMFKYWWAVPIFSIIIFLIYTVVVGLKKYPGEV